MGFFQILFKRNCQTKQERSSLLITFCGFVSGCEALALSGRAACTKPLLPAVPSVVYNEDCVEGLKRFSDNHFDLAIVDPPYGIRRDGHSGVKAKKAEHNWKKYDFKGWDSERPNKNYWDELFRVSKNQIVFGANYFTEYLPPSMGWIFWDKGQELTMSDGELIFTSFEKAMRRKIINRASAREEGMIHPTQKPTLIYNFCLDYAKVKNGCL